MNRRVGAGDQVLVWPPMGGKPPWTGELPTNEQELYALVPGDEVALAWRNGRGGVVRILEAAAGEELPWETAHDGVGYLAEEDCFAWERYPFGVEPLQQVTVGRPLRLLLVWSHAGADMAASVAASLGSHLAAGRVLVREVEEEQGEGVANALTEQTWDGMVVLGVAASRVSAWISQVAPCWLLWQGEGAIQGVRAALGLGVAQGLAMEGGLPPVSALPFWQAFWHGLLVEKGLDLPRATALGRTALLDQVSVQQWRNIVAFSRLTPLAKVTVERIHPLPVRDPRFLYAGERVRGSNGREIFRHGLWQRVERAFDQGQRLVGLVGAAGAGKSVMAHLLMERLHRHPRFAEEGRRVVWLNAGASGGTPTLWQYLADLFTSFGYHADPHWLGQQNRPAPLQLALMFKRLMGAHGWLVVDQCHATQLEGGGWRDPEMGALLTALMLQTGWRCLLTSRQPFDLCRDSPTCQVQWIVMPSLTWTERAALCLVEQEAFAAPEPALPPARLLQLVAYGDDHPLQVRLSLRAGGVAGDWSGQERLHLVLHRLLQQTEPGVTRLLQLLSLLHFVPEVSLLGGIWRVMGEKHGWQPDMYAITMGQLEALGLVEIVGSGRVWMASSVREWVESTLSAPDREAMQRDLALLFYHHGEQILAEMASLHPVHRSRDGQDGEIPSLLLQHLHRFMGYAMRHALQQSNPELIAMIFRQVLEQQGSQGCRGRLYYQAMDFWRLLEKVAGVQKASLALSAAYGVAGKAFLLLEERPLAQQALQRAMAVLPDQAPPELAAGLYYQQGLLHQNNHQWQEAAKSMQQALQLFQGAGHEAAAASVARTLRRLETAHPP